MTNPNIDKIKELLELYYQAQTTPEQEQQLTEYLLANRSLPDELKDDAQMFRAMVEMKNMRIMPEGFEQRLIDATCGAQKPRRRARFLFPAVTAAAAAIAIAVVLRMPQSEQSFQPAADDSTTAEVIEVNVANRLRNAITESEVAQEQSELKNDAVDPSPYIEISTPDSAATVVRNLFGKIGKSLACADQAANLPSEIIDNTMTTINNLKK